MGTATVTAFEDGEPVLDVRFDGQVDASSS
jgi:hypothetical protein